MPVNPDLVGRTYPPAEPYSVGREAIRDFARAVQAALIADPEAGIDFSRVVHADQRFTHHRPIVAGDELVAELHVDQVRAMGSGAMVTSRAEIRAADGEHVATTVSSLLVRGEDQ